MVEDMAYEVVGVALVVTNVLMISTLVLPVLPEFRRHLRKLGFSTANVSGCGVYFRDFLLIPITTCYS